MNIYILDDLMIYSFLKKYKACTVNQKLYEACIQGHRELAEWMIKKGADYWNWSLYGACRGGNRELVELMIKKGARDWNSGLVCACQGGYRELAEWMIEKGADSKSCTNESHSHRIYL